MSLKGLAEGIILQSIEDLWSEDQRDECIAFFTGKEFSTCAELAGINLADQVKILNLVKGAVHSSGKRKGLVKDSFTQSAKRPARASRRMLVQAAS